MRDSSLLNPEYSVWRVGMVVDGMTRIIRQVASPSLTQLTLRVALAVPFYKSGILKWNGFLRLNETAVTLFTDEFKLHLLGGPYDFPAPTAMAFASGVITTSNARITANSGARSSITPARITSFL